MTKRAGKRALPAPREAVVSEPSEATVPEEYAEPVPDERTVWTCPTCNAKWVGEPESQEWHAYKSHMTRHSHWPRDTDGNRIRADIFR